MSNPVIDKDGTKRWYTQDGELHRTDGPAVEYTSGSKFWYLNGERHRTDGPAIEWASGGKVWYLPAIERADGTKEWYLNGEELSEDLYNKSVQGDIKDLPLYLGRGFDSYISERLVGKSL